MTTATNALPLINLPGRERLRGLGVLSGLGATAPVSLPLTRVQIAARIAHRVTQVTMVETFQNPHQEHLEAVYIFPLAAGSAVSNFELRVGARTIRGKVEERAVARQQYQQAVDEGKRAALLEQERDDAFTVQVGNLPPGEEITVLITYSERLPFFEDGTTELRLPLVVSPRYIPGTTLNRGDVGEGVEADTDAVPDASRISPPRLAAGFDPKVDLTLEVELLKEEEKPLNLEDLCCSQHATRTAINNGNIKISLAREHEPLNRDFVLHWRVAEKSLHTSLLIHKDQEGMAYGMLSIIPPQQDGFYGTPRDVLFVLDRSGSMQGIKMASAARACSLLLATLGGKDRFTIQAFDTAFEWLQPGKMANKYDYFIPADEMGLERGQKYLNQVTARGGTELFHALGEAFKALKMRSQPKGRVPVIVLLTDGEVGDESRILKRIQQEMGDARIFAVGIDTAINSGLLKRLANLGGGTATFVTPGGQLEEALRNVGREIGNPLVVDVKVEDVDAVMEAGSLAPNPIIDLFANRATTAFFRLRGRGIVRVKGRLINGGEFEQLVQAEEIDLPAIAQLWARTRVTDLEDQFRVNTSAQPQLRK